MTPIGVRERGCDDDWGVGAECWDGGVVHGVTCRTRVKWSCPPTHRACSLLHRAPSPTGRVAVRWRAMDGCGRPVKRARAPHRFTAEEGAFDATASGAVAVGHGRWAAGPVSGDGGVACHISRLAAVSRTLRERAADSGVKTSRLCRHDDLF